MKNFRSTYNHQNQNHMKNLKKLSKTDLKSVYGGQPKKYCVYCERLNKTVCSEVPIAQCP